jgi:transposase InsO family protein
MAAANKQPFSLRSILEKDKLNGTNYADWIRNLRIVLRAEKKEDVLDTPLPDEPAENAPAAERNAYKKASDADLEVSCLMLASMEPDLQMQFDGHSANDMIVALEEMFQTQARTERFNVSKALVETKLAEGAAVGPHVIKLVGYTNRLEKLGFPIGDELATDFILASLPPSYGNFISNYHMHGAEKGLNELCGMLKQAEADIKKGASSSHVMAIQNKPNFKKKGNAWRKKKGKAKGETSKPNPPAPKAGPTASTKCFHCGGEGHWKRNCKVYLESIKDRGSKGTSTRTFVVYITDIFLAQSYINSWVFDTGSVAHICNTMQGMIRSRSVEKGEVDFRVGNNARVAALNVGIKQLHLPSGFILELNNCYFIPSLSRNIVSPSCLMEDGYTFASKDNGCVISRNGMFVASASIVNGLFILNLDDSPICNISAKKPRLNELSPTYMWHCRLGHISENRMKRLHNDGLLTSFDFESYETCEACLLGKMTKTPFTGFPERAIDLLELIHSDVCGPMSTTARGGFEYFVTFTDDFSRYGYVYLMKHKSETFEKFKEFQNEVENQRGKKIKALRSDRGGEYLSHEFSNHLKSCGIVSQLTPPGTPQRNGVSERRNRTLLDMVRSMMSQTDLPLSFWGYALETAAFTLNRVPSKSVVKTPYEMWTGKSPSLSFLKIWGCEVYVKRLMSDKLTPKSDKCFFVGYPKETLGYYFYNRSEGKVFVARNGVFLEKEFLKREKSGQKVYLEEVQDEPTGNDSKSDANVAEQDEIPVAPPQPRRSTRVITPSVRLREARGELLLLDNDEPATYAGAVMGPDSERWQSAMRSEIDSMGDNQVWNLVDPPDGVRPIECK